MARDLFIDKMARDLFIPGARVGNSHEAQPQGSLATLSVPVDDAAASPLPPTMGEQPGWYRSRTRESRRRGV